MIALLLAMIQTVLVCSHAVGSELRPVTAYADECVALGVEAYRYEMDVSVIVAIALVESRMDADAVGGALETSSMQVLPDNCSTWPCRRADGVRLYRNLVRRYGYQDAVCRYKGQQPGCSAGPYRMMIAAALRGIE